MHTKNLRIIKFLFILVIVILAGILIVQSALQTKIAANDVMAQTILRKISNALEEYKAKNDIFPSSVENLIGTEPPYTMKIYFDGTHYGFNFTYDLSSHDYMITAIPVSETSGTASYAITTGGHFK